MSSQSSQAAVRPSHKRDRPGSLLAPFKAKGPGRLNRAAKMSSARRICLSDNAHTEVWKRPTNVQSATTNIGCRAAGNSAMFPLELTRAAVANAYGEDISRFSVKANVGARDDV
jgi:hypothetical protein